MRVKPIISITKSSICGRPKGGQLAVELIDKLIMNFRFTTETALNAATER